MKIYVSKTFYNTVVIFQSIICRNILFLQKQKKNKKKKKQKKEKQKKEKKTKKKGKPEFENSLCFFLFQIKTLADYQKIFKIYVSKTIYNTVVI